jgi:hypothetical protein
MHIFTFFAIILASEGGAALYYGGGSRKEWDAENPSEVVNKFRNYEI